MRILLAGLLAFVWATLAYAQDDLSVVQAEAIAEAQIGAADTLRNAFEVGGDEAVAALRTEIMQRRDALETALAALRNEQVSLQERLDGRSGPDSDEGETPVGGSDAARLDALTTLIIDADLARRQLDELAAEFVARSELIEVRALVNARAAEIGVATRRLEEATDEQTLVDLRGELRAMRTAAQSEVDPLRESRDRLVAGLERLGPLPAEGDIESPELSIEREALQMALVEEDAIVRQSALNLSDINRLLLEIAARRRAMFYSQIFSRGPTPLRPDIVSAATVSAVGGLEVLQGNIDGWRAMRTRNGGTLSSYIMIGLALIIGFILFVPARRWINAQFIDQLHEMEPTPGRRAFVAALRILTRAGPGVVAGLIIMEVCKAQGVIDASTAGFAGAIWGGILALLIAESAGAAALSQGVPGWRLLPLQKGPSRALRRLGLALVFVFFADRIIAIGSGIFGSSQELALVQSAITAIVMGALIVLLTRKWNWQLDEQRQDAFSTEAKQFGGTVRIVVRALGALSILAAICGYVALAYFVTTRLFLVTAIILIGLFVRIFVHGVIRSVDLWLTERAKLSGDQPAEKAEGEKLLFFWVGTLADFMIALLFLPAIAMVLGAEWLDVRDWITSAFFGFTIGNVTISFAQIFGAFATFIIVLTITRFIQRTAEKRFFPKTRLDVGVQNSLRTIIGYIGLVIGVMTSISVLGFNLQNLAIIAGALSLGIGFGLQSIVNNFVSGLILLFERPVKVGDWIVVSSGEGTVKRISVRSTEIETFDRSTIIVPNSELISSSVKNWTHKDRWTRITIPIGVAYDAHPQTVLDLLDKVIKANKRVMKFPESSVFFAGFGDSSLDFEMRVFLRDTADRVPVQNEIRVATYDALKEAGIEIPFPQRDVHLITSESDNSTLEENEDDTTT